MKTLIILTLLGLSAGAMAQTTAGGANNQSTSSASTNAQGNTQAVNFNSITPANVTTNSTLTSTGASNTIVDNRGSYTVKNVPSVSGANLTTSNDTCMGSTSGSANGPGLGLSFGTTWTDEQCKRLKMSRELWNKGMKAASLAMDCMDPAAQAALEMTGTKCPQSMTAEERTTAFGSQASTAGAAVAAHAAPAPSPVAALAPAPPSTAAAPASAPVQDVALAPVFEAVTEPAAEAPAHVQVMPVAEPAPEDMQALTALPTTKAQAKRHRARRTAPADPPAPTQVVANNIP